MRVRVVHLQLDLMMNVPFAIDLDDSSRSRFGDHDVAVGERVKRVDFDPLARVAVLR